jgi:uncharacterized protein (TIGR02453 family)
MAFTGFSADTLGFLADLAEHNDRAWFAENRGRYDSSLLEPQREFVDAIGSAFAEVDPRVRAVPSVDRSIYRINRDIRFSKNKSPYKAYADLWFWVGDDRKYSAGYFLRMQPGEVWIGGGMHQLTDAQLAAFRSAVIDGVRGAALERILSGLTAEGFEVGESTLKRVPSGFSAQAPRAELLRYTWIHAIRKVSPPPPEFESEQFVAWCMDRFGQVKPLVDWLAETAGSE